jgi:hypothetical protein
VMRGGCAEGIPLRLGPPCDGRLVRAHLLPRRLIKTLNPDLEWDPRGWVWSCGGPMGNGGHHAMLDTSRRIRVPRDALPVNLEDFAEELGLLWWLDREYGR